MEIKIWMNMPLLQAKVIFILSFQLKYNTLNNVFMFQKMMMKQQRGRRPSKPKGKGLLCCLRRNAKLKILKKINSSKRRKKKKKKSNLMLYFF
jgi:hypothetical protein